MRPPPFAINQIGDPGDPVAMGRSPRVPRVRQGRAPGLPALSLLYKTPLNSSQTNSGAVISDRKGSNQGA